VVSHHGEVVVRAALQRKKKQEKKERETRHMHNLTIGSLNGTEPVKYTPQAGQAQGFHTRASLEQPRSETTAQQWLVWGFQVPKSRVSGFHL